MRLLLISISVCLFTPSLGGWLRDLISPQGWPLGDGLVLHLTDSRLPNSSFLERHSIMMDYGGYGVSVSKIPRRRALEVGLYTGKFAEARGTKKSMFSLIIGYKLATLAAIGLSAMGALVLKSLMVAKIAAITSTVLLISKLFHKQEEQTSHIPEHIELEPPPEMHSHFSEIPASGFDEYYPTGSNAYYSYASLPQGIDYAAPEHAAGNSTLPVIPGNQQVARRRDAAKRRRVPVITIHQYSVKT